MSLKTIVCGQRITFTSNTASFVYMNDVARGILIEQLRERSAAKKKEEKERKEQALREARQFITLKRMPNISNVKCFNPNTGKTESISMHKKYCVSSNNGDDTDSDSDDDDY